MQISFSKKFIFIANTKTASTTIEHALEPYSNINILATRYGKHMAYSVVEEHFGFMFKKGKTPINTFFRFGVIREPLDWVVSWYNYRSRDSLKRKRASASSQGITFDEFAREVIKGKGERQPYANIGSQKDFFVDMKGNIGVDYLIPMSRINDDLVIIEAALALDKNPLPEAETKNVSPKVISSKEVDAETAAAVRKFFAEDVDLYKRAENGEFGVLEEIIRNKRALHRD